MYFEAKNQAICLGEIPVLRSKWAQLTKHSGNSGRSEFLCSNANHIFSPIFSPKTEIPIATFFEMVIKFVVLENYEFEYTNSSKILAFWQTLTMIVPKQVTIFFWMSITPATTKKARKKPCRKKSCQKLKGKMWVGMWENCRK